ncbi:unnamed protein product [Peniophora sp. CBMAI 1063]|nr:unnamed protein product [Peniophora sp. CBMAI 1063]
MGYAAYAVTTGLEVGVFDADDWPLAAHYVHDIPQGARAVWKGYQTRARAQSTFDQMLQAGLVRLIDPTTGRTTVVNHRAARFRQASAPPAVLSPTGRLTPPPTPIIHSTSAPLPRRTRRERLAQTGGRENPSRVTAAPTAGSVSTSSSPPTGVTQLNRDDFSDESPRRPLASVSNIRNTRKDARTPQRQRTTPSHGVPPPPLSPSDSVSSEYAFSSPHTNASTQFGPPIRRGRDVAVPASPTPMGRDEPPSDRRKRRGAERSFRRAYFFTDDEGNNIFTSAIYSEPLEPPNGGFSANKARSGIDTRAVKIILDIQHANS